MVKALVIMMMRRLHTADAWLACLEQHDAVARQLRPVLTEHGRFPTRRTWERRLTMLPPPWPGVIGCCGRHPVHVFHPWGHHDWAVAVDRPPLQTHGGVWHKQAKDRGEIPHTSIATEAGWSKSRWQGWGYGWKLHLAVAVGPVGLPLAAELTAANTADNAVAPRLVEPQSLPLYTHHVVRGGTARERSWSQSHLGCTPLGTFLAKLSTLHNLDACLLLG